MLKQRSNEQTRRASKPAAFRRLCVETAEAGAGNGGRTQPPLGGCVLKQGTAGAVMGADVPAAFRRLCVETGRSRIITPADYPAAFRRLCVETNITVNHAWVLRPSRL